MDGFSVDVLLSKLSGKLGAVLGSGEDDGTADALLVDELDEEAALVCLFTKNTCWMRSVVTSSD